MTRAATGSPVRMGRPPSTDLTSGMVYIGTSEGVRRGPKRLRRLARHLVKIAALAPDNRARVRLENVVMSAEVRGDRWAVVGHGREVHHAASLAKEKLSALLRCI